jgi:hypothetical protein
MHRHGRFRALVFAGFLLLTSAHLNRALAQTPTPTPTPTPGPVQPGQVIISELRLRGPSGAEDEYVEIYNNTDAPVVVAATDQSAGWTVALSDGQITGPLFTIPNGTTIPARGHLLGANVNGYSLCEYPSGNGVGPATTAPTAAAVTPCLTNGVGGTFSHTNPDRTWDFDAPDGSGVALFSTTNGTNFTAATRLDAFGFTVSPALYREGAGFPTVVTLGFEHSYYRDLRNVTPRDTGDNAADFLLVGTSGGAGGIQSIPLLGAPGPENLNSPVQRNSEFATALLDPTVGAAAPPNRSRDFTPDPANNSDFGTLLIRRTITNNTGQPVTRLRFRVINITTLGTPAAECAGTPCADLRVRSSVDGEVNTAGGLVQVRGVRLEEPPEQPAGGGYNSSLSADFITLQTPLGVGESVNIEFRLGIVRTGPFRFFVNIEAQTGSAVIFNAPDSEGVGAQGATVLKNRKLIVQEGQSPPGAAGAPASPASAAPTRNVYVPLLINASPPASRPARAAEDEADDEDEEEESKEGQAPARPAPRTPETPAPDTPAAAAEDTSAQSAPADIRRGPSEKQPAAAQAPAKAPRRGGNK